MPPTFINILKKAVFLSSLFFYFNTLNAQNVGINATGAKADPSAMLDVFSDNKGILIPRVRLMNVALPTPIVNPLYSMMVFNTNPGVLGGDGVGYYWNSSETLGEALWTKIGSGGGNVNNAWLLNGNAGIDPATNFMGTLDDRPVIFKWHAEEALRIAPGGALLATGNTATGKTPTPNDLTGTRMEYIPAKAAFRVGDLNEDGKDFWNDDNIGQSSFAANHNTKAKGFATAAFGWGAEAIGDASMAWGQFSKAIGQYSTAFGSNTTAFSDYSIASGTQSTASGKYSMVLGNLSSTDGTNAIAIGENSHANGEYSVAIGLQSNAISDFSFALGNNAKANAISSVAMGEFVQAMSDYSFAQGYKSRALGDNGIAMGQESVSFDGNSIAMGYMDTAYSGSIALGDRCRSSGSRAVSLGQQAHADGDASLATGLKTSAAGFASTSLGSATQATGSISTAMGVGTQANGNTSTSMGRYTIANVRDGLVIGRYNKPQNVNPDDDNQSFVAFQIGNGTGENNRNDAVRIRYNGDMFIAGNLTAANFMNPSDIRLKKDIKPLKNILNKINHIQPINYNFKNQKKYAAGHQIGFNAQELQKEFPELVTTTDEGFLSVNYAQMTPVLLQAIKEQQQQIEELKKEKQDQKEQLQQIEELKKDNQNQKEINNQLLQRLEKLEAAINK